MNKTSKLLPAVLVAMVIAIVGLVAYRIGAPGTPDAGSIANSSHTAGYYDAGLGFKVNGTTVFNSSKQLIVGTNGTALTRLNFGVCPVIAYAATIAASSSATVDCGSTGAIGGTLSGVSAGDYCDVFSTTTISSVYQGVSILGSTASTTAGYCTIKLYNSTGATFTWTGAASTTLVYQALR
jgi:hypothetical protein